MLSFKRIFQTQQQALDVYKSQLSRQQIFVEAFEGAPKGTEATIDLSILETGQKIRLKANVERIMGKAEAVQNGYGQRSGLLLNVPITKEIVEPLRTFFLTKGTPQAQKLPNAPFINLNEIDANQAQHDVEFFLKRAENGNLFELFGMRPHDERKVLRAVYNKIVKNLHPDKHRDDFGVELCDKLGDAYQILNEAYKILQHPVACEIYLEISRENGQSNGMSLATYKKFQADYRLKNANAIHMADDLVSKAQTSLEAGQKDEAMLNIKLALKYDKYNEAARSMQSTLQAS